MNKNDNDKTSIATSFFTAVLFVFRLSHLGVSISVHTARATKRSFAASKTFLDR